MKFLAACSFGCCFCYVLAIIFYFVEIPQEELEIKNLFPLLFIIPTLQIIYTLYLRRLRRSKVNDNKSALDGPSITELDAYLRVRVHPMMKFVAVISSFTLLASLAFCVVNLCEFSAAVFDNIPGYSMAGACVLIPAIILAIPTLLFNMLTADFSIHIDIS